MMRTPKMRHCFNCGEETGISLYYDPLNVCGKLECEREARAVMREEVEHENRERWQRE